MKSNSNKIQKQCSNVRNELNQERNDHGSDMKQQTDFVYEMHNYCCNPEMLRRKCSEHCQKIMLMKRELGSAKRKIKILQNKLAFFQSLINTMKAEKINHETSCDKTSEVVSSSRIL